MQRIIVNLHNYVFSDSVRKALKNEGDFDVTVVSDPRRILDQCRIHAANLVLLEVSGSPLCSLEERMDLRKEILKEVPECKIVFFVDDQTDKKLAKQIKQAKRDNLIDLFIYGSSSAAFMVALLDTL